VTVQYIMITMWRKYYWCYTNFDRVVTRW